MGNASAGGLAYVPSTGGGGAGAAVTIGGNTAGAGAIVSSGTLFLAGGNNVTLSQNGQSITISGGAGGGASTAGLYGTGNTTNNSTTTLALSSQLFNFQGGVTGGFSNGSIQISAPAVSSLSNSNNVSFGTNGSTITASYALGVSAPGGTSNALSGITFSNSNGVSFGLSTGAGVGTMTASIAAAGTGTSITGNASITLNTGGLAFNGSALAGTNTAKTGNIAFTANSSGVSINASSLMGTAVSTSSTIGVHFTGAGNSAGITLSNPFLTRSIFPSDQLSAISAPGNASLSIQYVPIDSPLTATRIDALMGLQGGSAATTATGAIVFSVYMGISTRNGSTLSSLSSGSTQTTYTYASNSAGQTQLTASALRPISCPVNVNAAPGEYFVGVNIITNTSSIGASTTNYGLTMSIYGGTDVQTAIPYAEITANTATSSGLYYGQGMYTAATTGMPVSIGLANIAQTGPSAAQANIGLVFRNA